MSTWRRVVKGLKEPFTRQDNSGSTPPNLSSGPFPFLSLPVEIREEIYLLVFGGEGVHLLLEGNRMAHLRCCRVDPHCSAEICCRHFYYKARETMELQQRRSGNVYDDRTHKDRSTSKSRWNRRKDFVCGSARSPPTRPKSWLSNMPTSLLLVNKQISTESLYVLYANLTFQVDRFETLVCFTRLISPRALSSIRSLRASWIALACLTQAPVPPGHPEYPRYEYYTAQSDDSYRAFWRIVARNMPGLVELGLVMDYSGQYLSRAVDAQWHRPLKEVRGLGRFDLQIWDKMTGMAEAEQEVDALREHLGITTEKGAFCTHHPGRLAMPIRPPDVPLV